MPTDEISLTYEPSCTIEDAALYLMGYPQRSLQPRWVQYSKVTSDGDWHSSEGYQNLTEDWESAISELAEAKFDKASEEVIAAKLAKRDHCAAQVKLAHKYKTDIINELARGVGVSGLHIDSTATSTPRNPYITILSLKTWAHEVLKISILAELGTVKPIKSIAMARQQENAILDAIKKLGYDPQNLPKIIPGKRGVKAEVRTALLLHPLFKDKTTVFDKTWERLSKEDISFMK
jgi:hypothetical protein